jgi:hypothetical protein
MLLVQEKGYSSPAWEPTPGVEKVAVDLVSGYPSHDDFPSREEYVIRGSLPALPDPIHTKIKLCRGENKLATDFKIAAGDYEEKEFTVLKEEDPVSEDGKNRWQEAIEAWINGQPDNGRFRPPTEYCGDQAEIYVEIKKPENEKNFDTQNIDVEIVSDSSEGIQKIELWVNGSLRETINNREYKGTINLSAGQYELYAKAYSNSGKTRESNKVKIGTGGQPWNGSPPSPSPSPLASPSPTASPGPGNGGPRPKDD